MRITKIEGVNFKGFTGEYEIEQKNLILGTNGAGKTTIRQMIEYALTGKIEDIKNNEPLHAKFASGITMEVKCTVGPYTIIRKLTEDNSKMTNGVREYKYKEDVKVVMSEGVGIKGSKKVKEWISENINIPSVVFNFSEFAGMNSTERRNVIKSMVQFYEIEVEEILLYISDKLISEGTDDEYTAVLNEIIAQYEMTENEVTGEELINLMLETANAKFSAYNSKQKTDVAAISKFTEYKNDMDGNVRKISRLEKNIVDGKTQADTYKEQILTANNVAKRRIENVEKITELNGKVEQIKGYDFEHRIEITTEDIAAKESMIKELDVIPDHKAEINDIEKKRTAEHDKLKIADPKYVELSVDIKNVRIKLSSNKDLLTKIDGEFLCPITQEVCNADIGIIKGNTKLMIDNLIEEEKKLVSEFESAKEDVDTIEKAMDDYYLKIVELREGTNDVIESNNKIQRENDDVNAAISLLKERLAKLTTGRDNKDVKLKEIYADIQTLEDYKYDETEDIEEVEAMAEGNKEQFDADEEALKDLQSKQVLLNSQLRAIEDAEKSVMQFKVWKDVKKQLGPGGLQGHLIKQNLGEIQDELNVILKSIGREEEFAFRTTNKQGKEEFNFGWIKNDDMIYFDSLSGAEQMFIAVPLLKIFLNRMDSKVSLIMIDEINKIHGEYRKMFFEGMSQLGNELDNLILIGAIDYQRYFDDEVEVIEL